MTCPESTGWEKESCRNYIPCPTAPNQRAQLPGVHSQATPRASRKRIRKWDEGNPKVMEITEGQSCELVSGWHSLLKKPRGWGWGRTFLTSHLKFNYLPSQHFIQQDAKCPPIHGLPIGLISNYLENRRHPSGRCAGSCSGWEWICASLTIRVAHPWGVAGVGGRVLPFPDTRSLWKIKLAVTVPDVGLCLKEWTGSPVSTEAISLP